MGEYTLVFRRALTGDGCAPGDGAHAWVVTRPAPGAGDSVPAHDGHCAGRKGMSQVFAVPICSALGMDGATYERFLIESGALLDALALLGNAPLTRAASATTARKEIQALVMAAEVQHIIGRLSA